MTTPLAFPRLAAAVEDAVLAARSSDRGPADPTEYADLRRRLDLAAVRLPPLYREVFHRPFIATLESIGEQGFTRILLRDPNRESTAGLVLDVAHAILQNGERYEDVATDAFQEVVSDLYDGFLSAEDRRGVMPPEHGVVAPLVKWGQPEFGPYTFTIEATRTLNVGAAVVSLPPAHARHGLLAWSALGHETAGHDILHADEGLVTELQDAVWNALRDVSPVLADYWAERIDETGSDVLGILNMGPAAGVGLIGYFRALNGTMGPAVLRLDGPAGDSHPADILRAYLAAATVEKLAFSGAKAWARSLVAEADHDLGTRKMLRLGGTAVPVARARDSAALVAAALLDTRPRALEGRALGAIQNWRDHDEEVVASIRRSWRGEPATGLHSGPGAFYAAHVVAAAHYDALTGGASVAVAFARMKSLLKEMHDGNPAWGPLFVRHPGSVRPHGIRRRHGSHTSEPPRNAPLPEAVRTMMAQRSHRLSHYLWHGVRNGWARMSEPARARIRQIDAAWEPPRPAVDAGGNVLFDNDSGEDFLYMHREMIAVVNEILATNGDPAYPRVSGWRNVPAPDDLDFPVPPLPGLEEMKSDAHYERLREYEQRFTDADYLRSVSLGRLGAEVEFTIHNQMHMRWAAESAVGYRPQAPLTAPVDARWDDPAYDFLGDTYSSHVNPIFWKLHGWVDDRIDDWMRANGLTGPVPWKGRWVGPVHGHDHGHHPHHLALRGEAASAHRTRLDEALRVLADEGLFSGILDRETIERQSATVRDGWRSVEGRVRSGARG